MVVEVALMGAAGIQIGLLGPLQVHSGGQSVALAGRRCPVVLATLALSAGRTVTSQALVDDVWGEQLPRSATASLHSLMTRLRTAVGATAIRTVSAGYILDVDPDQVDLLRFRRLLGDATRTEEPEKARALLGEALSLWRGDPLDGLASDRLQRDVAPGLVEERLAAVERRIGLDLAAGYHNDLIAELLELTGRHPLRETLWRHLIVAQDEAGRRADALNSYHRLRSELRRRIGVEPSDDLRELYQRLLTGRGPRRDDGQRARLADPEAAAPPTSSTQAGPGPRGPVARTEPARNDLPGDTADFTGRGRELDRLLAIAAPDDDRPRTVAISAIDGMAGIGKTTLAVHLAHRLADRFPDGRLFIDLHGHTPGHEPRDSAAALGELLRALGVPGEHIPEGLPRRAGLWRAELAGRRVLVVLDNAANAAQVQPLIPGSAGCLAVVTSRRRIADLDGARVLSLDTLPEQDAYALFAAVAGTDRCRAEPDALAEVLELCGHLPLAIRIAAARLRARPAWSIRYLADRLADERHRLAELAVGERSVGTAFALSYEHLGPAQRRMFRLLGLYPGTFVDAYLAAALVGVELREAEAVLEDLVDAHLVNEPASGRYQFHDLLRHYARAMLERDESAEGREEAVRRMLDYYVGVTDLVRRYFAISSAHAGVALTYPPPALPQFDDDWHALAWCDSQRANLVAMITYAAQERRDEQLCRMLNAVWWFFRMRRHLSEWITAQDRAVDAADRLGDLHTAADMRRLLGSAQWESERYADAVRHYREAVELYTHTQDTDSRAQVLSDLGSAYGRLGRQKEALAHFERALADVDVHGAGGNHHAKACVLAGLAEAYRFAGRHRAARELGEQSLAHFQQARDFLGQGQTHSLLGLVYASQGDGDRALESHQEALRLIRACDAQASESSALNDLGETLRTLGRPAQARAHHEEALALAARLNNRYQEARAHSGIARTLQDDGDPAVRQHWQQALDLYAGLGLPEADEISARLGIISP
jgi:DNA-binding SARP family transcriptional activator/tetratricopeptide (TPR) repeat protein